MIHYEIDCVKQIYINREIANFLNSREFYVKMTRDSEEGVQAIIRTKNSLSILKLSIVIHFIVKILFFEFSSLQIATLFNILNDITDYAKFIKYNLD